MRVVLCTVGNLRKRVLHRLLTGNGVALLVSKLRFLVGKRHNGLIDALPVVDILALSPLLLERCLTLADSHRVVEVPLRILSVLHVGRIVGPLAAEDVGRRHVVAPVTLHLFLRVLLSLPVALFLLLLLQSFDSTVDGSVAVLLRHLGKPLQGVLQVYGVSEGHELVEHLRAVGQFFIVLALLVEHTNSLSVASLRVVIAFPVPIDIAETEQQDTLLYAAARSLGGTALVGRDGIGGVALCEIDVAYSIVHLVEIFLVLVGACHALQATNHLLRLSCRHHLRHGNARVELKLVRWILPHHVPIGFHCLLVVAQFSLELSHEKPLACTLLASHLMLDDTPQIRHSLGVLTRVYIVVGIRVVPFLACRPMDRVALHVAYHVLRVVEPALLNVAFGEPRPRLGVDGRLRLIESSHVGECGSSLVEGTLVKLRAPHQQPCLPEERVVFAAREPLDVLCRLLPRLRPLRTALNAVEFYGLLAFLYGAVEISLSDFAAILVADGVERNKFREVVLVAVLLLQRTVNIGERAVVIGVVARLERMPPASLRGVFLRGASRRGNQNCHEQQRNDMSCLNNSHVFTNSLMRCLLCVLRIFTSLFPYHERLVLQLVGQIDAAQSEASAPPRHLVRAHRVEHVAEHLHLVILISI